MSAPELAPGQIIAGKYAIQSLLGHGGAMATYHAMTAPNRQVALKLYDPALKSQPDVLKMLGRYQMATEALASRSIASITEIGEDPATGAPYTVTDLEVVPTLANLIALCPLSTSEMITLMNNLGRAVDLAHGQGIAHLALHPSNVFVGLPPGYEVRVLDFGSGAVRQALRSREKLERAAPWLAPEQMQDGKTAGVEADVFAAALVAFFAVSGRSYWRSCQAGAVDVAAWRREIVGPRVAVSQRAQELSLSLPPAFDAVFARALSVSPKDRFRTVGELAAALARAETSDGATDIPPPPAQMEAVLSAFEGNVPVTPSPPESAKTVAPFVEQVDFAQANDVPVLSSDERPKGPARARVAFTVGLAAVFLCVAGAYAMFSGSKSPSARAPEPRVAPSTPVASSTPVETPPAPPILPTPIAPENPPPVEASNPTPDVQPAPPVPTTTPRAPVWRRPAAAPRPPAKKPCGKFLQRCK